MATSSKNQSKDQASKNLINKIYEDKTRIIEALKKGENLSTLKGIKFVKPL